MNGSLAGVVPNVINGLPAHVLLVHVTVIVIPLAAACTVLAAVWPAARRRLGVVTPVLALAALGCVPVTVDAGEWLMARVGHTPLVARHADLAAGLLPWVGGLAGVAVLNYAWFRFGVPRLARRETPGDMPRPRKAPVLAGALVAVALALAAAVGSTVQVYRVGDSGARAAWQGNFSSTPQSHSSPR